MSKKSKKLKKGLENAIEKARLHNQALDEINKILLQVNNEAITREELEEAIERIEEDITNWQNDEHI